jgi:mycothiol synthase
MIDTSRVLALVRDVARRQGVDPLSEAKTSRLTDPEALTVISEGEDVVAVGVVAPHPQPDGSVHWAVETAVTPSLQFAAFERMVVSTTLDSVPAGGPVSVWSSRTSLDSALGELGFHAARTLAHMTVELPLTGSRDGDDVRPFVGEDAGELVRVNNAAFAGHREAGSMTPADFARMSSESWFDPSGILVIGESGRLLGFCWTKVHPNGDGEIFRIAVDPAHHGAGLGTALLVAGFEHLAARDDVTRGTLWVDMANRAAMSLYTGLGMRIDRKNVEFEPTP